MRLWAVFHSCKSQARLYSFFPRKIQSRGVGRWDQTVKQLYTCFMEFLHCSNTHDRPHANDVGRRTVTKSTTFMAKAITLNGTCVLMYYTCIRLRYHDTFNPIKRSLLIFFQAFHSDVEATFQTHTHRVPQYLVSSTSSIIPSALFAIKASFYRHRTHERHVMYVCLTALADVPQVHGTDHHRPLVQTLLPIKSMTGFLWNPMRKL